MESNMIAPALGIIIFLIVAWLYIHSLAFSKKKDTTDIKEATAEKEEKKKHSLKQKSDSRVKLFDKLREGKNAQIILFIWRVIITATLVFHMVYSHIQRENIISDLYSIKHSIESDVDDAERKIRSVEYDVDDISSRLDDIEYRLRWRQR